MSEPAVHSAEHILNQTMVRMFGCPSSRNAHIERKKSKCDYVLISCTTDEQVAAIEVQVANTSEIGTFKIISHDFNDGVWRLRWKIIRDED